MHRPIRAAVAVVGLSLILAGLAGPVLAVDRWVTMIANDYRPGVVTIEVGDRVTWVNDDDVPHDAVGNGWSTSLLTTGDSDSVRFGRAGRYAYRCSIHPEMRGAVLVRTSGGLGTVPPTDTIAAPDATGQSDGWLRSVPVIAGLVLLAVAVHGLRPRRSAGPPAD
jgi:plastocyanin